MTDKDIIKALECCSSQNCCEYCGLKSDKKSCVSTLCQNAHNIITRQQAENDKLKIELKAMRGAANSLKMHYKEAQANIERLNAENMLTMSERNAFRTSFYEVSKQLKTAKSEAVKEFAQKVIEKVEKARKKYQRLCAEQGDKEDEAMNIHFRGMINIVKEMTGENNE